MQVKLFEVRDRGTFIPAFAFLTNPTPPKEHPSEREVDQHNAEGWLISRAGFNPAGAYVVFGNLEEVGRTHYDPLDWPLNPRTMREAHKYVTEHWNELHSGDVIDLEFVLGECGVEKKSERGDLQF